MDVPTQSQESFPQLRLVNDLRDPHIRKHEIEVEHPRLEASSDLLRNCSRLLILIRSVKQYQFSKNNIRFRPVMEMLPGIAAFKPFLDIPQVPFECLEQRLIELIGLEDVVEQIDQLLLLLNTEQLIDHHLVRTDQRLLLSLQQMPLADEHLEVLQDETPELMRLMM